MLQSLFVIAVSALAISAKANGCSLNCPEEQTCYTHASDAMECMNSMPFNKDWATATVDVVSQSLLNYGFLQLYHNTGPPYTVSLDIQQELAQTQELINSGSFASDMDFQEHIQDIIQITNDAHTRYQKPVCYNAVFLQPFAFDLRVVENPKSNSEEPKAFLMRSVYTDQYLEMYPDSPVSKLFDQEVVLLNNLEFTTEITTWADAHETRSNNRGVRFNTALRSYLYRSAIQYNVRPLEDLSITMADGNTYNFPWMASYTTGFSNTTFCAAEETTKGLSSMSSTERTRKFPFLNQTHHPELLDPPTPLVHEVLRKASPERTIIIAEPVNAISCFTQHVSGKDAEGADVENVLVMKVASFAPSGPTGFKGFLDDVETCMNTEYDMMVVDVMQNGGGIVCLGLRLLELLIEDYWNDHTQVQMNYDFPHSELMDTYIDVVNSNEGYINKETGEPYVDGKAYYYGRNVTMGGVTHQRTNYFSLDCSDIESLPRNFKPKKFLPADKLVFVTDGLCGSTCACFTRIPQEHGYATLVGVGGLWEESMDVSSFAGGFVSNPDVMSEIAEESGLTFPKFLTNQHWQFDWAIWYSTKFPSRPAQFVVTEPDYRESFWGFPHASVDSTTTTAMVSTLYDRVIQSTLVRLNKND